MDTGAPTPSNTTNVNQDQENLKGEPAAKSARSTASQFIATCAVGIGKFSLGTVNGFNMILIAKLYNGTAGVTMTLDELTWFSSYLFMAPVSSIIVSLLTERVGNRLTILISQAVYIIAWIMFHYSNSEEILMVAQALTGLVNQIPIGAGWTYITEISQTHHRSRLITFSQLFAPIGASFSVLLAGVIQWKDVALINITFPVAAIIAISFIPESPAWLTRKNKHAESEKSLAWLRGWREPKSVDSDTLERAVKDKPDGSGAVLQNATIKYSASKGKLRIAFRPFLKKFFYLPLLTIFYMMLILFLTGSSTLETFPVVIFEIIKSPIDSHIATTIHSALRIAGQITCISIINYTGKKKLMLMSQLTAAVMFLIIAIFLIPSVQEKTTKDSSVAVVMILFVVYVLATGFYPVIFQLCSELFPSEFRNLGVGASLFLCNVMGAIVDKLFLYIVAMISLEGVFFAFSFMSFFGFFSFHLIVPETHGRTLKEIEDHYTNVNSFWKLSVIEKKDPVCETRL